MAKGQAAVNAPDHGRRIDCAGPLQPITMQPGTGEEIIVMRLKLALCAALAIAVPAAAQDANPGTINRIIDQGMNHSEVMETAAHLTDRIGGRMTNSPQMRETERRTQQRFRDWGLSNVRAEPFTFGRGWSIVRSSARMTALARSS